MKIQFNSKKEEFYEIYEKNLQYFLNQKWTCLIFCKSSVFLCLVLEVTQRLSVATGFHETFPHKSLVWWTQTKVSS